MCTVGNGKKTLDKLTDQPGKLIPLDRGGMPDLSVSGDKFDLAPRQGRAGLRERGEIASGGRKKSNERHNATSNNLTRKHTNSTMQIIERKCKAQKVAGTMI